MPNTAKQYLDYPGLQVLTEETKQYVLGHVVGGVQSDWNETDSTSGSYIKNKPILHNEVFSATTPTTQNTGDAWTEYIENK